MAVSEQHQPNDPFETFRKQAESFIKSVEPDLQKAIQAGKLQSARIKFVVSDPRPSAVKTEEADSKKTHDETSLYSSAVAKARISYDYARNNPGHVAAGVGVAALGTIGSYKAYQYAPSKEAVRIFFNNTRENLSAAKTYTWNKTKEYAINFRTAVESNPYVQSASARAAQAREYAMNSRPAVMFSQMGTQLKDKVHSGLFSIAKNTAILAAAGSTLLGRNKLRIGG